MTGASKYCDNHKDKWKTKLQEKERFPLEAKASVKHKDMNESIYISAVEKFYRTNTIRLKREIDKNIITVYFSLPSFNTGQIIQLKSKEETSLSNDHRLVRHTGQSVCQLRDTSLESYVRPQIITNFKT